MESDQKRNYRAPSSLLSSKKSSFQQKFKPIQIPMKKSQKTTKIFSTLPLQAISNVAPSTKNTVTKPTIPNHLSNVTAITLPIKTSLVHSSPSSPVSPTYGASFTKTEILTDEGLAMVSGNYLTRTKAGSLLVDSVVEHLII